MHLVYPLLAFAAGSALAAQVALNGKLKAHLGTPLQTTLVSLVVGAVAAFVLCLSLRYPWPSRSELAAVPWLGWVGGLMGVFYLSATVVAAPRIGVAATFGLVVAGQIVTAMTMDHFGLLDVPVNAVTGWKLLGAGLVVAGVVVLATAK